jgi:hypothetical protein
MPISVGIHFSEQNIGLDGPSFSFGSQSNLRQYSDVSLSPIEQPRSGLGTILKYLPLLLLLVLPAAHATDVTLSWAAPTANTDGSTPAVIGGYNIYSAATDAALTALPNTIAGGKTLSVGNVLTYTFKNVAPGNYVYAVTTWYCVTAGTNCAESDQAAHVSTVVSPKVVTPGIPGGVKITATVSAP